MDKYLCFRCNHELVTDSQWMGSDVAAVPEDKACSDEDFIITLMHCPYCGMSYELADVPPIEEYEYPYFNNGKARNSVV